MARRAPLRALSCTSAPHNQRMARHECHSPFSNGAGTTTARASGSTICKWRTLRSACDSFRAFFSFSRARTRAFCAALWRLRCAGRKTCRASITFRAKNAASRTSARSAKHPRQRLQGKDASIAVRPLSRTRRRPVADEAPAFVTTMLLVLFVTSILPGLFFPFSFFPSLPTALAIPVMRRIESDDPLHPECVWKDDPFDDLKDIRIYALIYYGRRSYVDMLNAYLERNLRENGGVLDGVLWALVKYDMQDLQYLVRLQRRNPRSYFIPPIEGGGWDVIWKVVDQPGAYYVKIDDDVIFIGDGAIPELIREKRRDRFLFVSANVINHGIVSAVHQELAQYPWLEKPDPNADGKLEKWPFRQDVMLDPNFRIEHTFYSDCIWRRWDCAAWSHEVLLHRIEEGSMCALDFGVFDFHAHGYETMSDGIARHIDFNINFFAFKYEDLSDISWDGIIMDDEGEFSTQHPKRRNQHAASLGRAIVSHWTFSVQEQGLKQNTTLLERYRSLAEKLMYENAVNFYDGVLQPRGNAF